MQVCFYTSKGPRMVRVTDEKIVDLLQNGVDSISSRKQNKDMKTSTFNQAVLDKVDEFRQTGQQFSIHDITRSLRTSVNDGKLNLSDQTPTVLGGKKTFRIEHYDVRQAFLTAVETGVVQGLTRTYNAAGGFNQYQDASVNPVRVPATVLPPSSPTTTAATSVKSTPAASSAKPNLVDSQKLKDYLNGRGQGSVVTMKQIQSRFDGLRGISCEDYATLLTALGYTVSKTGTYASRWTVTV